MKYSIVFIIPGILWTIDLCGFYPNDIGLKFDCLMDFYRWKNIYSIYGSSIIMIISRRVTQCGFFLLIGNGSVKF